MIASRQNQMTAADKSERDGKKLKRGACVDVEGFLGGLWINWLSTKKRGVFTWNGKTATK